MDQIEASQKLEKERKKKALEELKEKRNKERLRELRKQRVLKEQINLRVQKGRILILDESGNEYPDAPWFNLEVLTDELIDAEVQRRLNKNSKKTWVR
jgi:transcriptional regulatory protein LevR